MSKQIEFLLHDLANPLSSITLDLEYLQRKVNQNNAHEARRIIARSLNNLERINIYLKQIEQQNKPGFDLLANLKNILHFQEKDNFSLYLKIEISPDKVCPIKGNPSLFQRAVINLIDNAKQAICSLPVAEQNKIITVIFSELVNDYHISVNDHGPGIPSDQLQKIFSPGFSTKPSGTGLGLAAVKLIIEKEFNGRIYVNSGRSPFDQRTRFNHPPLVNHKGTSAPTAIAPQTKTSQQTGSTPTPFSTSFSLILPKANIGINQYYLC